MYVGKDRLEEGREDELKTLADHLKVDYEQRPFKLHITLGRTSAEAISIEALQSVLSKVSFPKSDYLLDDINCFNDFFCRR